MELEMLQKLLLSEIDKLGLKLESTEKNITAIDKELFKTNQHLATYNEQLAIHMKRWEASEKRLEVAEDQVEEMTKSVEIIRDTIIKFNVIYDGFKIERQQKEFEKELELRRKEKLQTAMTRLKTITLVAGILLAIYGFIQGLNLILELFNI